MKKILLIWKILCISSIKKWESMRVGFQQNRLLRTLCSNWLENFRLMRSTRRKHRDRKSRPSLRWPAFLRKMRFYALSRMGWS